MIKARMQYKNLSASDSFSVPLSCYFVAIKVSVKVFWGNFNTKIIMEFVQICSLQLKASKVTDLCRCCTSSACVNDTAPM